MVIPVVFAGYEGEYCRNIGELRYRSQMVCDANRDPNCERPFRRLILEECALGHMWIWQEKIDKYN